jgi:hypothetical protein
MKKVPAERVDALVKFTMYKMEQMIQAGKLDPNYLPYVLGDEARREAQALEAGGFGREVSHDELHTCIKTLMQMSEQRTWPPRVLLS